MPRQGGCRKGVGSEPIPASACARQGPPEGVSLPLAPLRGFRIWVQTSNWECSPDRDAWEALVKEDVQTQSPPAPRPPFGCTRVSQLLTGLPLGPSSPGGPLGPGGPAAPEGPASPFSPLSPLGPCRKRPVSAHVPRADSTISQSEALACVCPLAALHGRTAALSRSSGRQRARWAGGQVGRGLGAGPGVSAAACTPHDSLAPRAPPGGLRSPLALWGPLRPRLPRGGRD